MGGGVNGEGQIVSAARARKFHAKSRQWAVLGACAQPDIDLPCLMDDMNGET
jgi:hypothetical protein